MRVMVLETSKAPLRLVERPIPEPSASQVLVRVAACGVCRTDLHVVDGELPDARLPIVPGHEIVGYVTALGADVHDFAAGDRIGIPWLAHTCRRCAYCASGRENQDRPLAAWQFSVDQLDLTAERRVEALTKVGERAAGALPQHDIEGLAIGPRELVTDQRCECLEEFVVAQQHAALVVERRARGRQRFGAPPNPAGASHHRRKRM